MYIWDKNKHSIGIDIIDDQHKYFFSLINNIYNSVVSNDEFSSKRLSMELLKHANLHFKTEIEYLLRSGVSNQSIIEHLEEHYFLNEKIHEIINKSFIEHKNIIIDLAFFINEWISNHIINYDLPFFNKMKENNEI